MSPGSLHPLSRDCLPDPGCDLVKERSPRSQGTVSKDRTVMMLLLLPHTSLDGGEKKHQLLQVSQDTMNTMDIMVSTCHTQWKSTYCSCSTIIDLFGKTLMCHHYIVFLIMMTSRICNDSFPEATDHKSWVLSSCLES